DRHGQHPQALTRESVADEHAATLVQDQRIIQVSPKEQTFNPSRRGAYHSRMVAADSQLGRYSPVPPAPHLPGALTITLWDFSWYVRTGEGEPFADLDAAAAAAVERGYNAVRICAMQFLLFGSGLDTSDVSLDRLGGEYAQGVRWYDVKSPTRFDGRALLVELF